MTGTTSPGAGRLVFLLPGVARETLSHVIVGSLLCRHKAPTSHFRILASLIQHAGEHSDIVWACRIRLRDLAKAAVPDDPPCTKTVSRTLKFWREKGLIQHIERGSLTDGPSEHDWTRRGGMKRGEGPVGHYNLSALADQIAEDLVDAFRALTDGGKFHARPAGKFKDSRRIPEGRPKPNVDTLSDPFEEQIVPPTVPVGSRPPGFLSETSHSIPRLHEMSENKKPGEANSQKIPPTSPAVEKPFYGSKMSAKKSEKSGGQAGRQGASHQGEGTWHVLVAAREKGGRGFDWPGALVLVKEMAERFGGRDNAYKFIRQLIDYARWMEGKYGEEKGPGWLIETARDWPGEWGGEYERHQERERRRTLAALHESLQAANVAARQIVTPPAQSAPTPNTKHPIPELPDALLVAWPRMLAEIRPAVHTGTFILLSALVPKAPERGIILLPCQEAHRNLINRHLPEMEASLSTSLGEPVRVRFAAMNSPPT